MHQLLTRVTHSILGLCNLLKLIAKPVSVIRQPDCICNKRIVHCYAVNQNVATTYKYKDDSALAILGHPYIHCTRNPETHSLIHTRIPK